MDLSAHHAHSVFTAPRADAAFGRSSCMDGPRCARANRRFGFGGERSCIRPVGAARDRWPNGVSMGQDPNASRRCATSARRAGGHGAAHAAIREALQERTRARVPLQWAKSTGSQGVPHAARRTTRGCRDGEAGGAKIETAFTTLSDGGDAFSAAIYERQLPKARALAQKLAKR